MASYPNCRMNFGWDFVQIWHIEPIYPQQATWQLILPTNNHNQLDKRIRIQLPHDVSFKQSGTMFHLSATADAADNVEFVSFTDCSVKIGTATGMPVSVDWTKCELEVMPTSAPKLSLTGGEADLGKSKVKEITITREPKELVMPKQS